MLTVAAGSTGDPGVEALATREWAVGSSSAMVKTGSYE